MFRNIFMIAAATVLAFAIVGCGSNASNNASTTASSPTTEPSSTASSSAAEPMNDDELVANYSRAMQDALLTIQGYGNELSEAAHVGDVATVQKGYDELKGLYDTITAMPLPKDAEKLKANGDKILFGYYEYSRCMLEAAKARNQGDHETELVYINQGTDAVNYANEAAYKTGDLLDEYQKERYNK